MLIEDRVFMMVLVAIAFVQVAVFYFYKIWDSVDREKSQTSRQTGTRLEDACTIIMSIIFLTIIGIPLAEYITEKTKHFYENETIVMLFWIFDFHLFFFILSRIITNPTLNLLDRIIEYFHKPSIPDTDQEQTEGDKYSFEEIVKNVTKQGNTHQDDNKKG